MNPTPTTINLPPLPLYYYRFIGNSGNDAYSRGWKVHFVCVVKRHYDGLLTKIDFWSNLNFQRNHTFLMSAFSFLPILWDSISCPQVHNSLFGLRHSIRVRVMTVQIPLSTPAQTWLTNLVRWPSMTFEEKLSQ